MAKPQRKKRQPGKTKSPLPHKEKQNLPDDAVELPGEFAEILEELPAEKQNVLISVIASLHSGPLPPHDTFQKYNDTLPGAGDRILRQMEEEGRHRRALEKIEVKGTYLRGWLLPTYSFLLALVLTGAAIYLAILGHAAVAAIVFGTTILGLGVGRFFARANPPAKKK